MQTNKNITPLNISSRAFWDVDFNQLLKETDKYAGFIIRKVFQYGTFNDILEIIKYYGKETVLDTLKNADYLHQKTLHFAAAFFKTDKHSFKCYTKKQQHPSY